MTNRLHLGCRHDDDDPRHPDKAQIPAIKVTWPDAHSLIITINISNGSQEPIPADVRLYAAFFDGVRKPPPKNPDDQIKLALSRQPIMEWLGHVIPDASMGLGRVWSTGPCAYRLAAGVEHVVLVAKIDKPGHCEVISGDLRNHPGLATWFGQLRKPEEPPDEC